MNSEPLKLPVGLHVVNCRHGVMLANECDAYIGKGLIKYGEYCQSELDVVLQLITGQGDVVEVGANIGSLTVPMARRAKEKGVHLHAYEPQPFIFQNLCANLALNAIDNVRAVPSASGEIDSLVFIPKINYFEPGNFGAIAVSQKKSQGTTTVRSVRLDDEFKDKHVGLIKIDAEGAELSILKGTRETIERCRPLLYLENDRLESSEALIQWILERRYGLWWHCSKLYNENNYRNDSENLWPNIITVNMVGIPLDSKVSLVDFTPVSNPRQHPLLA